MNSPRDQRGVLLLPRRQGKSLAQQLLSAGQRITSSASTGSGSSSSKPAPWSPAAMKLLHDFYYSLAWSELDMRRRAPIDSKKLLAQLAADTVSRFGIQLQQTEVAGQAAWLLPSLDHVFETRRAAVRYWILMNPRRYGPYRFGRAWQPDQQTIAGRWTLKDREGNTIGAWVVRPPRSTIAAVIRAQRGLDSKPSYRRPDTLGWRGWAWDTRQSCLISPVQKIRWDCGPELRVEHWDEGAAVRGRAGIHACRLPKGDWKLARAPRDFHGSHVIGLVERFGKFVLGSEGWRAEWVIIRELMAADEVLAVAVQRAYPEVRVHVAPKGHWIREGYRG